MVNTRRRGAELEKAIYKSTLEILKTKGFVNLNFGNVSQLANTSKSVLYRRWDNAFELAFSAIKYKIKIDNNGQMDETLWTGNSLEEDFVQLLNRFIISINTFDVYSAGEIFLEASQQQRTALQNILDEGINIDIKSIDQILKRAKERGEIKSVILEKQIKLLPFDWIRYQILIRGSLTNKEITVLIKDVLLPIYLNALT